jgi:hypothetical protein
MWRFIKYLKIFSKTPKVPLKGAVDKVDAMGQGGFVVNVKQLFGKF